MSTLLNKTPSFSIHHHGKAGSGHCGIRQLGRSVCSEPLQLRILMHEADQECEIRGLEADQRVLAAHGCYALTATTGLTAQNTLGVQDIFVIPAEFVKKQINAGLEDIGADVIKLGKMRNCLQE